jgi:hypothetical protein
VAEAETVETTRIRVLRTHCGGLESVSPKPRWSAIDKHLKTPLQQLDGCIGYMHGSGKRGIAIASRQ